MQIGWTGCCAGAGWARKAPFNMFGAIVLLCGIIGVFFRWLIKNYDEEKQHTSSRDEQQQHRRRNRGKKNKGKQKSGKKVAAPTSAPAAGAAAGDEQRSSQRKGSVSRGLDTQEWPTLGGSASEQAEDEDEEEDLAALHAEMLKAAKSAAPGSVSGAAAAGGRSQGKGQVGVGDRVEGRFGAGTEWFPAIVTKTLHGGLVNLLYDDGERETRVPLSLVRRRGAPTDASSTSDGGSDSESSEEEADGGALPAASHRENIKAKTAQESGWEVIVQKPKKTRVERIESRVEANSNLKNRLKRQKKREKELAAREALRKKL